MQIDMTAASTASRHGLARVPDTIAIDSRLWFLPLHVVLMASVVLAGFAVVSLRLYEPDASHNPIALGCGLTVIALIVYCRYGLRLPWISASLVYLMLFWTFHYGLAFTAVLIPDLLAPFEDWEIAWLYWPNVRMAMILGLIGAAAFVLGVGLMAGRAWAPHMRPAENPENAYDATLYSVGWLMMLVGLGAAALALRAAGGVHVLSLDYMEFRATVLASTILQTCIHVSQLGCLLALCGASGRRWVGPLVLWTAFACVLLLLGLRNEAMIPLVSSVVVLSYRGVHFGRDMILALALASLVMMPAIKTFRLVGFGNRSLVNWTEVSPLETITELGGTLRAVKAYVDWIEEGDEYSYGATYWAPLDRHLLVRVLPDRERIPYDQDERVPARNMWREGPVGLSATGEAYYNFGLAGPFIFFGCVGALFGWLERRAVATPYGCAVLGIVMFLFYFNIRGAWLEIPARMAFALTILGLCYLLGRLARAGRTSA